eukprot:Clim_evm5s165 gene=Clim_evmTU5s165
MANNFNLSSLDELKQELSNATASSSMPARRATTSAMADIGGSSSTSLSSLFGVNSGGVKNDGNMMTTTIGSLGSLGNLGGLGLGSVENDPLTKLLGSSGNSPSPSGTGGITAKQKQIMTIQQQRRLLAQQQALKMQQQQQAQKASGQNVIPDATTGTNWKRIAVSSTALIPRPRHGHKAAAIRHLIFVFGGGIPSVGVLGGLHIFDTRRNEWLLPEVQGDSPPALAACGFDSDRRHRCYVHGGLNDNGQLQGDLWELKVLDWEWKKPRVSGQAPTPRMAHTFTFVKGYLIVFGGVSLAKKTGGANPDIEGNANLVHLNDTYCLDLATYHWTKVKHNAQGMSPPSPRESHAAVAMGNKLIIFGGSNGTKRLNDLYVLDTTTWTWSRPRTTGTPIPRTQHTMCLLGVKLFVVGGWAGGNSTGKNAAPGVDRGSPTMSATTEVVDMRTLRWERWQKTPPVQQANSSSNQHRVLEASPKARVGHCVACVGTSMYIWSGRDISSKSQPRVVGESQVATFHNDLWALEASLPAKPTNLRLIRAMPGQIELKWDPTPVAESYRLQIQIEDDIAQQLQKGKLLKAQQKLAGKDKHIDESAILPPAKTAHYRPVWYEIGFVRSASCIINAFQDTSAKNEGKSNTASAGPSRGASAPQTPGRPTVEDPLRPMASVGTSQDSNARANEGVAYAKLIPCCAYRVRLAGISFCGQGEFSDPVAVRLPRTSVPGPPENLELSKFEDTAGGKGACIKIKWQAPRNNGGTAVTKYTVQYGIATPSKKQPTMTTQPGQKPGQPQRRLTLEREFETIYDGLECEHLLPIETLKGFHGRSVVIRVLAWNKLGSGVIRQSAFVYREPQVQPPAAAASTTSGASAPSAKATDSAKPVDADKPKVDTAELLKQDAAKMEISKEENVTAEAASDKKEKAGILPESETKKDEKSAEDKVKGTEDDAKRVDDAKVTKTAEGELVAATTETEVVPNAENKPEKKTDDKLDMSADKEASPRKAVTDKVASAVGPTGTDKRAAEEVPSKPSSGKTSPRSDKAAKSSSAKPTPPTAEDKEIDIVPRRGDDELPALPTEEDEKLRKSADASEATEVPQQDRDRPALPEPSDVRPATKSSRPSKSGVSSTKASGSMGSYIGSSRPQRELDIPIKDILSRERAEAKARQRAESRATSTSSVAAPSPKPAKPGSSHTSDDEDLKQSKAHTAGKATPTTRRSSSAASGTATQDEEEIETPRTRSGRSTRRTPRASTTTAEEKVAAEDKDGKAEVTESAEEDESEDEGIGARMRRKRRGAAAPEPTKTASSSKKSKSAVPAADKESEDEESGEEDEQQAVTTRRTTRKRAKDDGDDEKPPAKRSTRRSAAAVVEEAADSGEETSPEPTPRSQRSRRGAAMKAQVEISETTGVRRRRGRRSASGASGMGAKDEAESDKEADDTQGSGEEKDTAPVATRRTSRTAAVSAPKARPGRPKRGRSKREEKVEAEAEAEEDVEDEEDEEEEAAEEFICPKCKMSFANDSYLSRHRRKAKH